MKKKGCMIGCIAAVLVPVLLMGLFFSFVFGSDTKGTEDIAYYQALTGELDGPNSINLLGDQVNIPCPYDLPKISELGNFVDYRFRYQAYRVSLFQADSHILIAEYEPEEYAEAKAGLDYAWRTEGIKGETEDFPPVFSLNGFEFRAVEGGYYPKEMFFVGTCDETEEIAYIYFYDQDLDFISPDMAEFLIKESGWREVIGK